MPSILFEPCHPSFSPTHLFHWHPFCHAATEICQSSSIILDCLRLRERFPVYWCPSAASKPVRKRLNVLMKKTTGGERCSFVWLACQGQCLPDSVASTSLCTAASWPMINTWKEDCNFFSFFISSSLCSPHLCLSHSVFNYSLVLNYFGWWIWCHVTPGSHLPPSIRDQAGQKTKKQQQMNNYLKGIQACSFNEPLQLIYICCN